MDPAVATTDWSRLPGEILVLIAKRLNKKSGGGDGGPPPTQLDLLRIGAVCKTWRSSLSHHYSSSTSFPLNLPFPMFPNLYLNPDRQGHFSLSHSTVYLLQPPPSTTSVFFLRLQKNAMNNKFHPLNPLSKYSAERVPAVCSFPSSLNLLDDAVQVSEIADAYDLNYVDVSGTGTEFSAANYLEAQSILVKQTAVGNGIVVTVIGGRLGFFRLGIGLKWTPIDSKNNTYHDVVYRGGSGRFYAVDYCGRTVAVGGDKAEPEVEVIVASGLPEMGACQFTRLVEGDDGDELYLVYRYLDPGHYSVISRGAVTWGLVKEQEHPEMPSYFQLYRLNESEKKWERAVVGLGDDRVFIIGDDYSFSVSVRDYPGLKGGCIYFSDTMCYEKNDEKAGIAKSCVLTWVHDLKDGRTGPLADFPDHWPAFSPLPAWLGVPPLEEMLLQRDASNPKQDVPEPTTQAKKKAAKAKLRGDDAFRRQDYSMALDAYNQAIDFDPTNGTLLSNRSICWIHMGQAEHALADAEACRALKPYWPKACYREGHALQLLEKFEEAAGAFYDGLMLDPKNKDILHAFREVAEALEKRKVALAVDNRKLLQLLRKVNVIDQMRDRNKL